MDYTNLISQLTKENPLLINIRALSRFLLKNDLLNIIYGINEDNKKEPQLLLSALGLPKQIINIIRSSLTIPLEELGYPLLSTPILRRVYQEKKPIYFKKVPDLVGAFIPAIKMQNNVKELLYQLKITDIATAPILIDNKEKDVEFFILCVLGPLKTHQLQFVKESVAVLENCYKTNG